MDNSYSSTSTSLTTVGSDKIISGPFTMSTRDNGYFSREHSYTTNETSARSSTRSVQSQTGEENTYENIQQKTVLPKDISALKTPKFPLKRNLFILSEEDVRREESSLKSVSKTEDNNNVERSHVGASQSSQSDETIEFQSFDMSDDSPAIKLPAVVANSYKKAQKDIPVTFY